MTKTKTYHIRRENGELVETKTSRAKKTYTHAVILVSRTDAELEHMKEKTRRAIEVREGSWIPAAEKGSDWKDPDPEKAEEYREEVKELKAKLEKLESGEFPEMEPCVGSWHTRRDLAANKKKSHWNTRYHCEIVEIEPE